MLLFILFFSLLVMVRYVAFIIGKIWLNSYNIILDRYLLSYLGIYIEIYEHTVIGGLGPYKGCTINIVGFNHHNLELYDGKIQTNPK